MVAVKEETTMAVKEIGSPKTSSANTPDVDNIADGESNTSEKHAQHISEDQYPHGAKLVILAAASMVAVFMIALDQVSTLPPEVMTWHRVPLTQETLRPSSAQQFLRLRTSSTASMTCHGMPLPTS
jgi:hypothetical protein